MERFRGDFGVDFSHKSGYKLYISDWITSWH